ncbi:MAG: hypothetical protein GYB64_14385 [Chloroflexi bacterium]|nr:hypothetical protein [Chloroflexota bacterium]
MFEQILDLFGQPPGSLVYHFIVLFAVQAALAISVGQLLRDRKSGTARLVVATGVICFVRFVILAAAWLTWQGVLARDLLLPPIERAVDTVTVIAAAWLVITMKKSDLLESDPFPDAAAAVLVSMTAAGFVGTYYYWSFADGQTFNGQILDYVWSSAQIVVAAGGLIWMVTRARYLYDPFLKGLILIVLGSASALHVIQPVFGDVPAAIRLGQLIAIPMVTAMAYRHVVEQLLHYDDFVPSRRALMGEDTIASTPLPPVPETPQTPPEIETPPEALQETVRAPEPQPEVPMIQPSGQQVTVLEVVEALEHLLSTLEEREIIREAPRTIATALKADVAMLAVIDEQAQEVGIVGGYDNIAQSYLPAAILDLAGQPSMVNALGRLRQMRLTPQRNRRELRSLYENLGITHEGPTYLQPLTQRDERIGLIVVGSPYSERLLSNEERNLLDRLGPLVTASLLNAERYEDAREEVDTITQSEGARLANLSDELTAAKAELSASKRQIEEMKVYIRDMHRELQSGADAQEQAQQQTEALLAELERLRDEAQQADVLRERLDALQTRLSEAEAKNEDAGVLAEEVAQLREDNARLREQAQQRGLELERLKVERAALPAAAAPEEQALLQQQLDELRSASQVEIASLRTRLAQAAISQQEVVLLQEQLGAKTRELVDMQTELTEARIKLEKQRERMLSGAGETEALLELEQLTTQQAQEISRLRDELDDLRAGSDGAQAESLDREAISQLEAQLTDRNALIDMLEDQLDEKSRAISDLRTMMSEIDTILGRLERELSEKTVEVVELQSSLADVRTRSRERIAELENQLVAGDEASRDGASQAQLDALEAELQQSRLRLEALIEQLDDSQATVREMEARLLESTRAVDEALYEAQQVDSRSEVIASLAQELRTPMSSIMGYTELLLRESVGILGTAQRKFLQRVKANTERMNALLDDMIRVTAVDTGRVELSPQRVDVVYTVEEAITSVTNQFREKGILLRMNLAEDIPPLTADRDALLEILGHLLSNAGLASPVGSEVYLTVGPQHAKLRRDGDIVEADCLYIAVEDSGGGIDPDDVDRVFVRKYRADNPLIEGLGDTGVSLSLTRALVEAHEGNIWTKSEKGIGTTFHVLLPLNAAEVE